MKTIAKQVTTCASCHTEVGPARIYCAPCKEGVIDAALQLRSNATARGQEQWLAAIDRLLTRASRNIKTPYEIHERI